MALQVDKCVFDIKASMLKNLKILAQSAKERNFI